MTQNLTPSLRRAARWIWRYVKRTVLLLAIPLLTLLAVLYAKSEQIVLGAEAYIYGYPLVITDVTRANSALNMGPENQLRRVRQFPDARFKEVVRPNVDTLYTNAFIDTAAGPWVFEMAANNQRYEVMAFMDAWTNVFAAPGTRMNGTAGGTYLLVGPHWQGNVPAGMVLMRASTHMVWLIGRTQTNGIADYPLVHRLQDGLRLRSLSDWQSGAPEKKIAWQAASTPPVPAPQQMQQMRTYDFFVRLALLMVKNPPSALDGPMVAKLARLGLTTGQTPNWSWLDQQSIALGRLIADWTVAKELKKPRDLVRGWSTPPSVLGNYATFYNIRAVVAMVGLGANLPADATYPNTQVDDSGQRLHGKHRYRLHFKAGELPPVHAFWSITAYGADDLLIDNPINRYALGDRDTLQANADGSLDIWIQAHQPNTDRLGNWLPVKGDESFVLNARLYWPKANALDGSWGMPSVERLD